MVFFKSAHWGPTPRFCALTVAVVLFWPNAAQAQVAAGDSSMPAASGAPATTIPQTICSARRNDGRCISSGANILGHR